jgi:Flp pilus assembly protein TadG
MIRGIRAKLGSLAQNDAGVGTVEFAFIVPIALLLLLMGFDTARYALTTQRIEEIANTAAEMLAQTAVNSAAVLSNDGTVSDADLQFYGDSAIFIYPDAAAVAQAQGVAWSTQLVVNMTSINFVASPSGCTTSCTYKAKVVWTTNNYRPCGSAISAVADTTPPSASTLPTDVFGPGSIIVVDAKYTWKPTFGAAYLPSFAITRSAFMAPRNVSIVEAASGDTLASNCSGVL